jgi:hypothetical protein
MSMMIQRLENRVLYSTSPEQFDLLGLLGYDRRGASYKYRTTEEVDTNDVIPAGPATFSSKLTVASAQQLYDNHLSNVVKQAAASADITLKGAWFEDSTGTYSTARSLSAQGLTITTKLHNTRLAPQTMDVGTKYTDDGTMDGSVRIEVLDSPITGSFSGTTAASARLAGRQSITVRGTTYANAVKGFFSVVLSGTIKLTYKNQHTSGPARLAATTTFWAVPGIGVVKLQDDYTLKVTPRGEDTTSVHIKATSNLISYVLPV